MFDATGFERQWGFSRVDDVLLLLIGVVGLMVGSDEGVGCVFVNLSGGLDDVQNVRVNVSWDPVVWGSDWIWWFG